MDQAYKQVIMQLREDRTLLNSVGIAKEALSRHDSELRVISEQISMTPEAIKTAQALVEGSIQLTSDEQVEATRESSENTITPHEVVTGILKLSNYIEALGAVRKLFSTNDSEIWKRREVRQVNWTTVQEILSLLENASMIDADENFISTIGTLAGNEKASKPLQELLIQELKEHKQIQIRIDPIVLENIIKRVLDGDTEDLPTLEIKLREFAKFAEHIRQLDRFLQIKDQSNVPAIAREEA